MQFLPPFVSVAFAALAIAFLSPTAHAQELKVVFAPELAGGEVFVEGLLHLRFVGPERTPARPDTLATTWKTYAVRAVRRVIVTELRFPGQSAESWKAEHLALVAKLAAAFPMLTKPETVVTYADGAPAAAPELAPFSIPRSRLPRLPRRFAALSIEHGLDSLPGGETHPAAPGRSPLPVFELPQPYTLIPMPARDRASRSA